MKDFKPMLAGKWADTVTFPRLASVKLDGIRCLGLNGDIKSRKLLSLPNNYIRGILGDQRLDGIDGELIVGDAFGENVMQATSSFVMSEDKVGEDFAFWVFDLCDPDWKNEPYVARFSEMVRRLKELPDDIQRFIRIVEQVEVQDQQALLSYEDKALDVGYEGVMLRDPLGKYKHGRATTRGGELLKLKRFEDAEARIVGWEEEQQNNNEATKDELGRTKRSSAAAGKTGKGVVGKLLCETLKGEHFEDGVPFAMSGFTAKQKAELWEIRDTLAGRFATYKFFARGVLVAPRHPNFKAFRDPIDMGTPA